MVFCGSFKIILVGYLSSFRPVTTNLLETSGPYFLSEYSEGCLLWRGLIVSVIVTKWAFSLWMHTLQRDLRRSQKNGNVFPGWNNICPSSQVSNCSVHFGVTIEFPPNAERPWKTRMPPPTRLSLSMISTWIIHVQFPITVAWSQWIHIRTIMNLIL